MHEALQGALHVVEAIKSVHSLGTSTEFSRCLRAAQQEHTQDRNFRTREVEDLLQTVLVLGHAAFSAASRSGQAPVLQRTEGAADCVFVERHNRLTIVLLIARVHQRIQGEGIVVRGGDVLLYQRTQDADFDMVKQQVQACGLPQSIRGLREALIGSPNRKQVSHHERSPPSKLQKETIHPTVMARHTEQQGAIGPAMEAHEHNFPFPERKRRRTDHVVQEQPGPKERFPWALFTVLSGVCLSAVLVAYLPRVPHPASSISRSPGRSSQDQVHFQDMRLVTSGQAVSVTGQVFNGGKTSITGMQVEATFKNDHGDNLLAQIYSVKWGTGPKNTQKAESETTPIKPNEWRPVDIYLGPSPNGWNKESPDLVVVSLSSAP